MQGKVEICGVNTSELRVLSAEESRTLLVRAKSGDLAARDALVEGNLRLVLSVLQRFAGRGENMDDLFQVGCIGLLKAIENFDVSLGLRFSTYGVPMISGEIRRYLRDGSPLRVSRSLRDTAYHVLQARERLTFETGREPTEDELAQALGIRRQVGDKRNTDEQWLEQIALTNAVQSLDEREKRILALRYYAGKTQTEVASEIGISQAQVSRLEKSAIGKIKKNMQA